MSSLSFEEKFERGKARFEELNTRNVSKLKPGRSAFNDVTFSHLFGDMWCREGLSLAERSFIVCSALIALGKEEELKIHFPGLMNQGYSVAQIEEMCLHLAHYAGWPNCVSARRALAAVVADPKEQHIVEKAKSAASLPPREGAFASMPGDNAEQLFARGKVLFSQLTGKDVTKLSMGRSAFNDVTFGALFGNIWCRPGLSLKERSLMVNVALIVLGKEDELASPHAGGLLHQGFTREQYEEMCLFLAHYSGWPTAVGGRCALAQVLKSKSKL